MKRFIICCFIIAATFTTLSAQYKPFQLGLKASPTIGWFNASDVGIKGGSAHMGFLGGFIAEINFTENYMILTGLNYHYTKGRLTFDRYYPKTSTPSIYDLKLCSVEQTVAFQYVEIPLAVKLRTNQFGRFRFYGNVGLNTAFRFSARADSKYTLKDDPIGIAETKEFLKEDVRKDYYLVRESLLIGGGVDFSIDESSYVSAGINFNTSLNNLVKAKYIAEGNVEKKIKATYSYVEIQLAFVF